MTGGWCGVGPTPIHLHGKVTIGQEKSWLWIGCCSTSGEVVARSGWGLIFLQARLLIGHWPGGAAKLDELQDDTFMSSLPPALKLVGPRCLLQRALRNAYGSSCVAVVTPLHNFLKKRLVQSTNLCVCVCSSVFSSAPSPLFLPQISSESIGTLNRHLQGVFFLDSWEVSASFWKTGSLVG